MIRGEQIKSMKSKIFLAAAFLSAVTGITGCMTPVMQAGTGTSEGEMRESNRPEDDVFLKYLVDIYNKNDIINGYPVEILTDDEESYSPGSWTAYKYYAIADTIKHTAKDRS